jgi:cobalt-zinc-cadmium efflux system protein
MGHSHALPSPVGAEDRRLLRFRLGAVLLIALAACGAQFVGALLTGSISLLAESVHMLVDLIGLAVAFGVSLVPRRPSAAAQERLEALSALIQSTLLVGVGIYAAIRGLRSLVVPHPIAGEYLLVFASVGLVANLVCVGILYSSRKANLNFRAAFLEVISDALGSLVVIAGGIAVLAFGFLRADAIAALGLAALMIPRGIGILRSSLAVVAPRRKRRALAAALLLSTLFGLGVSQLHQQLSPADLHLDPPAADGYSWISAEDSALNLRFDRESGLVTLEEGCSQALAPYERTLGGVLIGGFEVAEDQSCGDSLPAGILTADSAYYSEDFRELQLYTVSGEELARFGSAARSEDQQRADSWRPLLELLFRL